MSPQISAVAFDLDGTLVDSMGRLPEVYTKVIRLAGGPELEPEEVIAAFHVGSTPALLSHFLGRAVRDAELAHFYDVMAEAARSVPVFAGVAEMLSSLKARRVPLGLFTGAARRTTELLLDSHDFRPLFDAVVAGDEVTRPKPCVDGLLMVCEQLHLAPENVAYVGDAQVDVDCALEAGCLAVVAAWGRDADELERANTVVTSPADIVDLIVDS